MSSFLFIQWELEACTLDGYQHIRKWEKITPSDKDIFTAVTSDPWFVEETAHVQTEDEVMAIY